MVPLRITDQDGVILDGGARTQGLPSFGMQDGQEIDGVRPELGRFAFNDAKRGTVTAELVADASAPAQIADLEAQIIEDLRAFAASMETALQPWVRDWEDSGWWGVVSSVWAGAKNGAIAWWEGEGEFWSAVWDWFAGLPEMAGEAWDSLTEGAKALWENKEQILRLLQDLAEGSVVAFRQGLEALGRALASIPGLEEIADLLRLLVQQSAEWMGALYEMARTEVLKVLGATLLGVVMATTPNFWAEMVGTAGGYLIPEIILAIIFAFIAFFTGGTGGAALAARLSVFVGKVATKLRAAGPAGAVILRMFGAVDAVGGKMVSLVKALKRNIAEEAKGSTNEVIDIRRPIVRKSSLSPEKTKEILDTPKGSRPDPSTYMSQAEIDEHLAQFDDGAVRFADVESMEKYGTAGPPGGFVMPKSEFEQMLSDAGGNLGVMEEKLGFDPGHLTGGKYQPVLIEAEDFNGIRIPSGNEGGANDFWLPGGYTSGGMPEAVMDFDGVDFTPIILD
ncbi:hypothetical protein C9E81_03605 [Paracoccus alkanivorans]|uniref:Uncharacterized protein n=2 Tax=Paracoccus alkanivorans TaxID=2116655 RepID=A0A3M0MQ20_9RHOB|nr:hypothetical protein C9E81_03605 [Paracoccus alkanivorans]